MVDQPKEELQSVYGLRLMRAFFRIKDQKQRHAVIELTEQLCGSPEPRDDQYYQNGPGNRAIASTQRSLHFALSCMTIPICERCKMSMTLARSVSQKQEPAWRCFKCESLAKEQQAIPGTIPDSLYRGVTRDED